LFVAWAGFQMLKLKSWTAAVVANVLMMIPCFSSCCCIIGVPLGIWGLIVLFNKDVKSAFVAKEAA
jgi:ABC-type proline/glycine betaine transport system permease subunit